MATAAAAPAGAPDTPLRRAISSRMLLLFVIGDVLGAGIYALVGEVGGRVGGAIWAAFALALALAFFTAFAYAELVTKYPHAAGAALYANKAFRKPFLTFMVAFAVMASGLTSAATLARAFGGDYLSEFVSVPTVLVALVFIAVMAAINFRGVGESVKVNVVLTLIELVGLALVVVIGLAALGDGGGDVGRAFEFKEGEAVPLAILAGAGLAFFALIGFEDSVNMAEETREPRRAYPRALFGGLIAAGIIYLLVTLVASMVVPTARLAESDGPLLEVVQEGPLAMNTKIFAAIALFALANGALINMIMASRLVYGMARESIVPPILGRVHGGRRTPWVAILFTAGIAGILAASGDLESLADTTVLLLLVVFAIVNVSVLVLRRDRVEHDHFRAPAPIVIVGAVVSLALLTTKEGDAFLRAAILLAIGALLWLVSWALHGRHQRELDTGVLESIRRPDDRG
ncbi:MAG TPA: APC family permease [Solirubrobacteraceae bacterium]|nr:APC family permease [Solirubrobacteraceae bacterium]